MTTPVDGKSCPICQAPAWRVREFADGPKWSYRHAGYCPVGRAFALAAGPRAERFEPVPLDERRRSA